MRTIAGIVAVLMLMSTAAEGQSPCASPGPVASFGDGTWMVGADIAPGTYRAQPESSCYWKRVKGFTGALSDIVASDFTLAGPVVVTIGPTDAGFGSSGCGTWSLVP